MGRRKMESARGNAGDRAEKKLLITNNQADCMQIAVQRQEIYCVRLLTCKIFASEGRDRNNDER